MALLNITEAELLKTKITSDASTLSKIFKSKNQKSHKRNVDHNRLEEFEEDGWVEYSAPLKTKSRVRKDKTTTSNSKMTSGVNFTD